MKRVLLASGDLHFESRSLCGQDGQWEHREHVRARELPVLFQLCASIPHWIRRSLWVLVHRRCHSPAAGSRVPQRAAMSALGSGALSAPSEASSVARNRSGL